MSGFGRSGRARLSGLRGKAALLAGVSLLALGLPAWAAPLVIDADQTISTADISAENVWVGFAVPDVELTIDGTAGPASLSVTSGNSFYLGVDASGGITTLTGSSAINTATLSASSQVFIGYGASDNTMTLNAYSNVTASSVVLGVNANSDNNKLDLRTGTSTIDITNDLIIGHDGADNAVTLANGASIDAGGQVILGFNSSGASGNELTLSSGSSVTADVGTVVGNLAGGNALKVESGADYTTYTTTLGSAVGSDGNAVTVTGAGSTYTGTTNASFNVGDGGKSNTLQVADGAIFDIGDRLALGKTLGSTDNIVTVTGSGSELHAGNVRIGITTVGSSGNSLVVEDYGYVQVDTDIKVRGGNSIDLASGARLDMAGFTTDAGSTFVLDVDAENAIDFDVAGAAVLAGTLEANYSGGTLTNRYRVLSSTALTNTMALDATAFGPNFVVTFDSVDDDLYLAFAANLGGTADLGDNQDNLADAVNSAFADGAELSDSFVALFGIADADLDAALSGLTGEINAYVQTELGWSATEKALGMLTDPDLCVPEAAGGICVKAFGGGNASAIAGNADEGNHDTEEAGFTLGLASAMLLGSDTLLNGLLAIDQTQAAIDGLGSADVTGLRFGAGVKHSWDVFYAGVGAVGGVGMGAMSRDFTPATSGSATADLSQLYFGVRGEIGANLALGDSVVFTPFGALDWANTATAAYSEAATGDYADLALAYGDNSQARATAEIGVRLATAPSDTGLTLSGAVAYRRVLSADEAVATEFQGLDSDPFAVTAATTPEDLLKLSADASLLLAPGVSFGAQVDVGLGDGYQAVAGKIGLAGQF